ncbi:ABC transporter permease [uncultured Aquimarina sp.]|uniref:ABC transporter permease n=1 Tax=uncultured Aquimarina sp. TaxID=575652 RepID=UPI002626F5B6|nr:ABC transporter permease [uncultured Aquimarina sp.]
MVRNYIKIAFRNFWRNKLNSFINLVGLSLGLAACILITMYVSHEKSYDQFHTDSNRIFNIAGKFKMGDSDIRMIRLSSVVSKRLKERDPNVEDAFRYYKYNDPISVKTSKSSPETFSEDNTAAVDANFFSFFSFDLLRGDASKVLENPFSVVLTNETAEKYFGTVNPIGKQIIVKQDSIYNFTVTGVVKQFPTNSSIKADILISMSSLPLMKETEALFESKLFQGGSFATYLKLKDINKLVSVEDSATELGKLDSDDSETSTYSLAPFTNTHSDQINTGRFNYLNVFPIVALLILILALTNYISLTTARAGTRAKEVGVRKISGANRKSLALQFYIESGVFVCISFLLGLFITAIFKDHFLALLNIEIDSSFFFNWSFITVLIGLLVFAVITSGVYPAMVLSRFNPIKNFRNKLGKNTGSVTVRKVTTTLQFTIAVLLVVCGVVMATQLDFMRNKDTGLQKSNIIMIPVETTINTNATAFRNEIEKLPEVTQTSVATNTMYGGYNIYFSTKENSDESYSVATFNVDEHFIETLGVSWYLQPKERTAFSENKKIIINQKTISDLGLKPDPRGEQISFGSLFFEIAGVVKDFNYTSLESPIKPLAFFVSSEASANKEMMGNFSSCLYVKYADEAELSTLMNKIEMVYTDFDETTPFSYQFMDDAFDKLYKAEERMSSMFYIFMVLALVIAGLGLLGLVTFASEQRVKEIGIRKVLGASISEIVLLLSTDFMKLVFLAIIIALPIAWYLADNWLNYFAYRIDMPWWSFVIASLVAIILSMTTVSYRAVKAAIANPVNSLKTE